MEQPNVTGGSRRQVLRAIVLALMAVSLSTLADAHGRVMEPPQRSSMWRRGFYSPINYNDHELFCGGFARQWNVNGGKCGICGDPYDVPPPRPNEAGGRYATGVITRTYGQGDVINITVEITANHKGYFVFKLCPNNDVSKEATQECLNSYVLKAVDERGQEVGERYYIDDTAGFKYLRLRLPDDVTCSQCVLQWTYNTGNSWGCSDKEDCCIGCGPQEQFVNCVDIAISPSEDDEGKTVSGSSKAKASQTSSSATSTPSPKPCEETSQTTQLPTTTKAPATTGPKPSSSGCRSVDVWAGNAAMQQWCITNCALGFCPPTHCTCS